MTDQQHPITPPRGLMQQWMTEIWHEGTPVQVAQSDLHLAACAAQWGADQELTECCKCIYDQGWFANPEHRIAQLRAARRPKPPSLKEQGLQALEALQQRTTDPNIVEPLRLAVEALPDD